MCGVVQPIRHTEEFGQVTDHRCHGGPVRISALHWSPALTSCATASTAKKRHVLVAAVLAVAATATALPAAGPASAAPPRPPRHPTTRDWRRR